MQQSKTPNRTGNLLSGEEDSKKGEIVKFKEEKTEVNR